MGRPRKRYKINDINLYVYLPNLGWNAKTERKLNNISKNGIFGQLIAG